MLTEVFGSFQDNGTDIPTQDITNLLSKYMEKSTYDTDNNGIVDTVESLSEDSVINGGNA